MQVFFLYTYATAAWLGAQSAVLVLMPKIVIGILAEEAHHASGKQPTLSLIPNGTNHSQLDVELYFGRALGLALSILALIVLFFTGTIPISTSISEPISLEDNDPKAPYAQPIVLVTFLFHATSTIYCWVRYTASGQTGYILGSIAYGGLACLAGFLIIFGGTSRVSSRTGEDKRTSGFPFSNTSAYDKSKDRKLR